MFIKYTKNIDKIKIGECSGYSIIKSGINYFDSTKIYLDTASVDDDNIISKDYIITINEKPSRANMQPIPNSVWFAKLKDSPKYIHVTSYMNDLLTNYIFSTGFMGLKCDNEYISNYFYALITSEDFINQKNALSIGATMQWINNESFKEILVPSLSINQMNEFGLTIYNYIHSIYTNKIKIEQLSNLKKKYLSKFFD